MHDLVAGRVALDAAGPAGNAWGAEVAFATVSGTPEQSDIVDQPKELVQQARQQDYRVDELIRIMES